MAWLRNGVFRVLFGNHHGKGDLMHLDGVEHPYA